MDKVNIARAFAALGPAPSEQALTMAGQSVRLVRAQGEGAWHSHAAADETALVWSGRFRVEYRDGDVVELEAGQVCVVPRGREHRGVAPAGAEVVLFRPA